MDTLPMPKSNRVSRYLIPIALVLGCIIPTLAGGYRFGAVVLEGDWAFRWLRDHSDRVPFAVHMFCAIMFLLLCTAQIWPGLRKRRPALHRAAGKWAIVLGVIGAATGLWLTLVHPGLSGPVHYWGRLVFSSLWRISVIAGYVFVRRRNFIRHRNWMIRAYAITLPAGTVAFIFIPIVVLFGEPSTLVGEIIQVGAWVSHLAIAEWVIRRPKDKRLGA